MKIKLLFCLLLLCTVLSATQPCSDIQLTTFFQGETVVLVEISKDDVQLPNNCRLLRKADSIAILAGSHFKDEDLDNARTICREKGY